MFSDFLNLLVFNTQEQLGGVIRALQTRGLFQSLAEPNLIAQDGKEASFLAGGEFPFPVIQGSGGNNSAFGLAAWALIHGEVSAPQHRVSARLRARSAVFALPLATSTEASVRRWLADKLRRCSARCRCLWGEPLPPLPHAVRRSRCELSRGD